MTATTATKLQAEIACYDANRASFVDNHRDEYVLIKNQRVVGFFKSEAEGIKAGYEQFGNEAFLVRQCAETQTPVLFTSLFVGR